MPQGGEKTRARYEELKSEFEKKFRTKDTAALDVALATIATAGFPGDPLWVYVVGPPSSLKTEILGMMEGLEQVEYLSGINPNSIVSGWSKEEGNDLLPKLDRRTLVVKDFTTTLEMNRQMRDALFGVLRDCYDG